MENLVRQRIVLEIGPHIEFIKYSNRIDLLFKRYHRLNGGTILYD